MKLLLDQNISRKLLKALSKQFPDSNHAYILGLHTSSDEHIWGYAKDNNFIIVTQDSDFNERSILYGYPPKVIWVRIRNTSTQSIKKLLLENREEILKFGKDKKLGCLILY